MKKIFAIVSVLSLFTFSANAFEVSDVSATVGISGNTAVYGATGKETNRDDSSNIKESNKESGVFTDSHMSGFIEVNMGEFISLGYEHTPDSISTPENRRITNQDTTTKVSADFNDLNIAYLKFNVPMTGGIYLKAGYVETDIDVNESMASGSTYANVSTEGTVLGIGYNRAIEGGLGVRIETSYMQLDDVSTNNGVSTTGATVANSGRNQVDVSNMEGLNAKLALTFTFGQ